MLEKKTHLSSVLQSLGCIAQTAMPVYETQEKKVQGFIKKDLLGSSEVRVESTCYLILVIYMTNARFVLLCFRKKETKQKNHGMIELNIVH